MVITLTLNPAVDQTEWIERLVPGTVHRVSQTHIDPAGKGINASRMTHRLGWPTIAFGLIAGDIGNIVEKALRREQVQYRFFRVPGQTRVNVTLIDKATSLSSSFYGPGPEIPPENLREIVDEVRSWLQAGRVLVLAGSVPPGVPQSIYTELIALAHEHGVVVILDTDGAPLRHGLEARPDLIKPNVSEAERILGRKLSDRAEIVAGARELARKAGTVVISMGAEGAICVQGEHAWHVRPPEVDRRSTVGSGDAMVAGLAVTIARGGDIVTGLRLGTAAGAATAMSEATELGTAAEVEALIPKVGVEMLG